MFPLPQMAKMSPEIIWFTSQQNPLILHCGHRGVHSGHVFHVLGSNCASGLLSTPWRSVGQVHARGGKSHTIWLSLIFLSSHDSSTAPQQPEIKTLFSPFEYYQPKGCRPNSSAVLQVVRDPRARTRSSLGQFSPWGIWAIVGRTKALGFLPQLTLQMTWCTPLPAIYIYIDLPQLPALSPL